MQDMILENGYSVSSDKNKLDIAFIHHFLSHYSYWAKNILLHIVETSVAHSLCYGVYLYEAQVGFARVITDQSTFGYLADVFVVDEHRGKGLSKALMDFIMQDDRLQHLRRFMLATADAHGLYSQFGFAPLDKPERIMQIVRPGIYNPGKATA
jgi:GNAT superfamily N-acetyltransferase